MIVPIKLSSIIRVSISVPVTVTPLHVVVLTTLYLLRVLTLLLIIVTYTLYVDYTVAVWLVTDCVRGYGGLRVRFLLLSCTLPSGCGLAFVLDCV